MRMPRSAGECEIRPAPVTLPSYPHRSTLTNTAVVWNARDTANSSINKVQRFPKQRSSHRTPTPIVSQFRQEQFPCVGTNCAHMSRQTRVLDSPGSLCHRDPRKFLWWSRTLVSGLQSRRRTFGPGVMQECARNTSNPLLFTSGGIFFWLRIFELLRDLNYGNTYARSKPQLKYLIISLWSFGFGSIL